MNKCIDCAYLMTCKVTDENKRECEYFRKSDVKEIKNESNRFIK